MRYYIYLWRGGRFPEGTEMVFVNNSEGETLHIATIHIDNIHEFAVEHGDIRLIAPSEKMPLWSVYITHNGWGQR